MENTLKSTGMAKAATAPRGTIRGLANELRMQSNTLTDHVERLENILAESGLRAGNVKDEDNAPEDPSLPGTLQAARDKFNEELERLASLVDTINSELLSQ